MRCLFLRKLRNMDIFFFSLLVFFLHDVKVANLNDCHISDILAHFFLMGQSWLQRNWGHYTSCLQIFNPTNSKIRKSTGLKKNAKLMILVSFLRTWLTFSKFHCIQRPFFGCKINVRAYSMYFTVKTLYNTIHLVHFNVFSCNYHCVC